MRDDDFSSDGDIMEDTEVTEELINVVPTKASKAWRSIERYREIKELRKQLDDLFYEENPNDLKDSALVTATDSRRVFRIGRHLCRSVIY